MAGWIKLHRNVKDKGHLKMPAVAFKLWIYCQLEAAPYPNQERNLKVGELWLSYKGIQQDIGENGKTISMSTISKALKYLEQNGYITLQPIKFKGIKARVINWAEDQMTTSPVTRDEPASTTRVTGENPTNSPVLDATSSVSGDNPPSTHGVTGGNPDPQVLDAVATPAVNMGTHTGYSHNSPTTTPSVSPGYSHNSHTTTSTVAIRAPDPYSDVACGAPKNKEENKEENKDLKDLIVVVVKDIAIEFSREFRRTLSPLEIKQLTNWQDEFSPEVILEALSCAVLQDKRNVAYVGGILKNWRKAGVTTLEEARREQDRPVVKGGKRNGYYANGGRPIKPGYRPSEVDWENEPDTL